MCYLIQHGPSRPDELLGGGTDVGLIFLLLLLICFIFYLLFLFFSRSYTKKPPKIISHHEKLLSNAQNYSLSRNGLSDNLSKEKLTDKILQVLDYPDYNKTELKKQFESMSIEDVRKVYLASLTLKSPIVIDDDMSIQTLKILMDLK